MKPSVSTLLLITSLTSYYTAYAFDIASYGHKNPRIPAANFDQIEDCRYTYQITDNQTTCDGAAGYNTMSARVLQQLNPWLDCSTLIAPDTLVCVASPPPPKTTADVSAAPSTAQGSFAPTLSPGNQTAATAGNATATAASSTLALAAAATPTQRADASTETQTAAAAAEATPSEAPAVPLARPQPLQCLATTTCAPNQCGTTISDNCGNPLACPATITDNCGNQMRCPDCPCVPNTQCASNQCGTTIWDNCWEPVECSSNQCGSTIWDNCGNQLRCPDCPPSTTSSAIHHLLLKTRARRIVGIAYQYGASNSAQAALDMHNRIRSYVNSIRGTSLAQLSWSSALESQAYADAVYSVNANGCSSSGLSHNPDYVSAIKSFIEYNNGAGSECAQYFNNGVTNSHFGFMVGGYTQLGCSIYNCGGSPFGGVVGCDYA
ncbi:hypothetical protein BDR26DRAFT_861295 [Obelidium mucronatum]|nr:hypothetical protein BDR26DRAFT_861295 [Obelidium mucronatum]